MSKQIINTINTPKKNGYYSRSFLPSLTYNKIGSPIVKEYGAKLDKNNNVVVGVIKSYDITEQIQSFRKETDIYYLIQKFENGDSSAFTQRNNLNYGDVSEMPNSLIDFSSTLAKLQGDFSLLSSEFKEKYNLKNVRDYLNALTSGVFFEKETPKATPKETPKETPNETSKETLKEVGDK